MGALVGREGGRGRVGEVEGGGEASLRTGEKGNTMLLYQKKISEGGGEGGLSISQSVFLCLRVYEGRNTI